MSLRKRILRHPDRGSADNLAVRDTAGRMAVPAQIQKSSTGKFFLITTTFMFSAYFAQVARRQRKRRPAGPETPPPTIADGRPHAMVARLPDTANIMSSSRRSKYGRMRIFVTLRRKPDRMKGGPVSDPRGSKAYKQTSAAGGHSIPLPSDASNRTANAGRLSLRGARSSNGVGVQSSIEIMRNPCLLAYAPTLRPEGEEDRGR